MDKLTRRQEKFLNAILINGNISQVSQELGISRNTAYNYLNDVTFRRIYRERRNEMLKRTTTMLQSASIEAVKVLQEIMLDESVSPYARQQSAQTILSMAYKANEQTEILEMIEELEIKMKVLES
ncbi:TPA: replication protein [Streptococcus suis]|nr:replication protein [Streptococcus hyovaginalis]HEM6117141.1 replication protein [Streptococcus suis]